MKRTTEERILIWEEKQELVQVAIWKNTGKNGTFFEVTVSRRDKNSAFSKSSQALQPTDLPSLALALHGLAIWLQSARWLALPDTNE